MGILLPDFFGMHTLFFCGKQIWSFATSDYPFRIYVEVLLKFPILQPLLSWLLLSLSLLSLSLLYWALLSRWWYSWLSCLIFLVLELVFNDGRLNFRVLVWTMSSYIDENSSNFIWNFPCWADLKSYGSSHLWCRGLLLQIGCMCA